MWWLGLWAACQGDVRTFSVGAWTVDVGEATFDLIHPDGAAIRDLRVSVGAPAEIEAEMAFGAFRFAEVEDTLAAARRLGPAEAIDGGWQVPLFLGDGDDPDAYAVFRAEAEGLRVTLTWPAGEPWTRWDAACDADEHVLGLGSHAMDVDHVGQAFPLWVSEPGIGKTLDEDLPDDWFLTGTRHASGYPMPWLLRPQQPVGMVLDTDGRVEVDLCASDSARLVATLQGPGSVLWLPGPDVPTVVRRFAAFNGLSPRPPDWAFQPWVDAIRGVDRVMSVAQALVDAGAPTSVIWTEDWKGANETASGYRLSEEWTVDEELYPEVEAIDAELEAMGFKWFAYFAPFVGLTAESGASASAAGALVKGADGADLSFTGVTFAPTSLVDVFSDAGRTWARDRMIAAADHGFDGWMADYGEWLPTDATVATGDGYLAHNAFPAAWQQINAEALSGRDAAYFCRSGWLRTTPHCPIVWVGDQRTSFDADDGFPSVIPLTLGLSLSGVPVVTHDVAGYQSVGNPPSDKELWYRWAELGAFSPIFRTHHGSFEDQNWQFDQDEETFAFYVELAREHARLLPYRLQLADQAAADGTPMVRPVAWEFPDEPWDRADAWMLGPALLVAPVLERDVRRRQVDLPSGAAWVDWWTGEPATSGEFDVPLDHILVFRRADLEVPVTD